MRWKKTLTGLALGALVTLGAQTASANTIQLLFLGGAVGTTLPGGVAGTTDFVYQVSLTATSTISPVAPNGRLVIEDFEGFNTAGSGYVPIIAGTNYTFTSYNPTTTPNNVGVLGGDLVGINNVEFNYSGTTLTNSTTGTTLIIGTLFLNSNFNKATIDDTYTSDLRMQSGDPALGPYTGPGNDFSTTTVARNNGNITVETPLPAAAWGGLGLLGLVAGNRARKARR